MIEGLDKVLKQVDPGRMKKAAQGAMQTYAAKVIADAVQTAPSNEGKLRQSISVDYKETSDTLQATFIAGTDYAAYQEFGTGPKAASYVASLPAEWKEIAKQYQGLEGGKFEDFVKSLTNWVNKKGLAGTYSVKTKKRTGNKKSIQSEDEKLARFLAFVILKKGIRPRRFMYLAITYNQSLIQKTFKDLFYD
jgi:HK97 gp10 family phage protein